MIHLWECGLVSNKDFSLAYLVTSLDGWLVYADTRSNECNEREQHAAVEIKSPTSDEMQRHVQEMRDLFGEFTRCHMGDATFEALVYKPQYRAQVLHHAAVCNLSEVLFIVANEFKPIYATLITFSHAQRCTYLSIVKDCVYEKSLKWAYTSSWNDADHPEDHFPEFREAAISTQAHSVENDCVLFHYVMWRSLLKMVEAAGLPLPIAKRIIPAVVSWWNKNKGRIDEMSRHLKGIQWHFSQATPKQRLTLREIEKLALNAFLAQKHCYHNIPAAGLAGKSFQQVRRALSKRDGTFSDFMLELGRTFRLLLPTPGLVPRSPLKRSRPAEEEQEEEPSSQSSLGSITFNLHQRESTRICSAVKRNKLHRFQTDEELNRIRLDKTLNHTPVVDPGVYVRCTLCSSGRPMETHKQHHSAFYCPTCCVYLCVRCHDGTRKSCMTKWHSIQNPSNLGT